jgi:hypothetical protein
MYASSSLMFRTACARICVGERARSIHERICGVRLDESPRERRRFAALATSRERSNSEESRFRREPPRACRLFVRAKEPERPGRVARLDRRARLVECFDFFAE